MWHYVIPLDRGYVCLHRWALLPCSHESNKCLLIIYWYYFIDKNQRNNPCIVMNYSCPAITLLKWCHGRLLRGYTLKEYYKEVLKLTLNPSKHSREVTSPWPVLHPYLLNFKVIGIFSSKVLVFNFISCLIIWVISTPPSQTSFSITP